jgi:hypothetical protein
VEEARQSHQGKVKEEEEEEYEYFCKSHINVSNTRSLDCT